MKGPRRRQRGAVRTLPIRAASPVLRELYTMVDEAGYSHKSVAEAIGTVSSSLSHWKVGRSSPSLVLVEAFAEVLGYRIVLEKVDTGASDV